MDILTWWGATGAGNGVVNQVSEKQPQIEVYNMM